MKLPLNATHFMAATAGVKELGMAFHDDLRSSTGLRCRGSERAPNRPLIGARRGPDRPSRSGFGRPAGGPSPPGAPHGDGDLRSTFEGIETDLSDGSPEVASEPITAIEFELAHVRAIETERPVARVLKLKDVPHLR